MPIVAAAPGLIRLRYRQRAAVAALDDIVRADDRRSGVGLGRRPQAFRLQSRRHRIDLVAGRRALAGARLQFGRILRVDAEIGVMGRDQVGKVRDLVIYVERAAGVIDLARA